MKSCHTSCRLIETTFRLICWVIVNKNKANTYVKLPYNIVKVGKTIPLCFLKFFLPSTTIKRRNWVSQKSLFINCTWFIFIRYFCIANCNHVFKHVSFMETFIENPFYLADCIYFPTWQDELLYWISAVLFEFIFKLIWEKSFCHTILRHLLPLVVKTESTKQVRHKANKYNDVHL